MKVLDIMEIYLETLEEMHEILGSLLGKITIQKTSQVTYVTLVPYQSVTLDVTSEDRRIGISLRETNPLRV